MNDDAWLDGKWRDGDSHDFRKAPAWRAPATAISARPLGDCCIVSVRGEFDVATSGAVRAQLDAVRGESPVLVLDLREVEFLDASGMRVALEEQQRADSEGYRFAVVRGPRRVQRLFEIAGLPHEARMFVDSPVEVCRS